LLLAIEVASALILLSMESNSIGEHDFDSQIAGEIVLNLEASGRFANKNL